MQKLVEDKAKLDAIESKLENTDNNLDKKDIKTNIKILISIKMD